MVTMAIGLLYNKEKTNPNVGPNAFYVRENCIKFEHFEDLWGKIGECVWAKAKETMHKT